MSDETPVTPPAAAPWYKLAVVQRLALGIVLHIIALSPLAKYVGGLDIAPLVNDALNGLGLALDSWALHARVTKPCPVVVTTQAKADAVAATIPVPVSIPSTTPEKSV